MLECVFNNIVHNNNTSVIDNTSYDNDINISGMHNNTDITGNNINNDNHVNNPNITITSSNTKKKKKR